MYWRAVGTDADECGAALGAVVVITSQPKGLPAPTVTAIDPISPGGISLFWVWGLLPVTRPVLAVVLIACSALAAPVWLPLLGTGLAVSDPLVTADVALVLEGTGRDAVSAAEAWRQQGDVRDVVIVEAPVKTHALVAYWSDFVRWGLSAPSPTPADHLRLVRAPSTQASQQAQAALPALQADGARAVLVVGAGGIGSRVMERQLSDAFSPEGISVRMVPYGDGTTGRDPARWYQNADDRRAVLDSWLQLLVPFLSGYDTGS